jgi:hypothetical protein
MNSINQLNHEGEFQRAWADPNNTRFELHPVDVNRVLEERYRTSRPLTFTRTMLWVMEVRKAWRPEDRLVERFTRMANDVWLPEFIEIYIRRNLNIKLKRMRSGIIDDI